jgi:DNA-binding transcriptional regulator of glucitol operon
MLRVVIVAVVVAVAFAVAFLAQRRAPHAPARSGHGIPEQLDRADFVNPSAPWLIAVFTSATCDVCVDTWQKASVLESADVAVQQIEYQGDRRLHDRYAIEAVPLVLVVDDRGVVRNSFVGPVSATHLWAAVAEARESS